MIIHVVQAGETIYTIAAYYNVDVTRLVEENGLVNPENLVVGQTIVIAYPEQVYIGQEGDTLDSISRAFGVTRMQLLRNNPFLFDRNIVYQGETIVISYETQGSVSINAYAYPFIDKKTLRKTLPYLTYLTIFNYQVMENGDITGQDDTEIIAAAREYGVATLMSLSTLSYQGRSNIEATNNILYNTDIMERHIGNILTILREKEFYGLNVSLINLNSQNKPAYENFMTMLSRRLKAEGFLLFISITPRMLVSSTEISFEQLDYTELGRLADYLQIISYGWGSLAAPPSPSSPVYLTRMLLQSAVTMIPSEKIFSEISVIGYDWQSPYVLGISRANALTTDAAIELALETNSIIMFEENSQTPYFEYTVEISGRSYRHIVWFKDARSIDALIKLVPEYELQGSAIWNIMSYFAQMWLVINSQYNINKVLPEI